MVHDGAQAGGVIHLFPHEHNHSNTTVPVTVPDGVNKVDVFQVALAYDTDHDLSCPPEMIDVVCEEFEETQGPFSFW